MKPATIHQIKKELRTLSREELMDRCLRLAKYKVENKELLSYLLFQSQNETDYVQTLKSELKELMDDIEPYRIYIAKKNIRRILRTLNKHIKFSKNPETEVELRISFCEELIRRTVILDRSRTMQNLYLGQLKRIHAAAAKLHEDLQYDYAERIEVLEP